MNEIPSSVELIDAAYRALNPSEPERFPLSGSSAGHCPRKLLRLLQGAAVPTFGPRARRIFEYGHQREEALASKLAEQLTARGYQCARQVQVWTTISEDAELARLLVPLVRWAKDCPIRVYNDEIQVRSHIDLAAIMPANGQGCDHLLVREFKTAGGFGFKKLNTEPPGPDYQIQLAFQAEGIAKLHGCNLVDARWVYESKDNGSLLEIAPTITEVELELAKCAVADVLRAWLLSADEYAPPRFANPETKPVHKGALGCLPWQCTYCSVGPRIGNCLPEYRVEPLPEDDDGKTKWEVFPKE